ncbi:IS607 family element RNA-guided endonuclease TnpB [Nonomuraea sp. NPDC050556]|uniref:IS607 family element RNA-guided endonuclease TnpB n=1 Tax=Nonomuraea sp. NPDC050556 TaxID=3364369 RepID=UPI003798C645
MKVVQAYRFVLDPTPRQVGRMARHCGAARLAFNWGLAQVKANLGQREAEKSYGIAAELLTPALPWNLYGLRRVWNRAKASVAPWWAECSKEAYNTGLDQLARALKNWHSSRSGRRKGARIGFPRFKKKGRCTPSCCFTTGAIRIEADRHHITLPVVGTLKTHESTRKLARRIDNGAASIKSATICWRAGRWWASFVVEVERAERRPVRPEAVLGVDLGVKTLAVFSNGRPPVANPRHYEQSRRKLARRSRTVSRRQGPNRRTGQLPSNRWKRANAARNKVHHHIANLRADALHKLTTSLVAEYGTIVVEDLNVSGMVRNHRLARVISDAGFGEIRRQLAYKTRWNSSHLVVADRWFPSSKTCSSCGAVKPKLPLQVRTYDCERCGLSIDRDVNAATNLAALVERHVAGSGPEAENGRGADRRTRPSLAGGREASTLRRAHPPGSDRDLRLVTGESPPR